MGVISEFFEILKRAEAEYEALMSREPEKLDLAMPEKRQPADEFKESGMPGEADKYSGMQLEMMLEQEDTSCYETENILAHTENAGFMKKLLDNGYRGRIKLIYIDPPFFSGSKYKTVKNQMQSKTESDDAGILNDMTAKPDAARRYAYSDVWNGGMSDYLVMLAVRLKLMKELLSDDGTVWVHLDWHSSHYIKVLMDEIFGEKNFINEIVWTYKSGGSGKRHFARKHDVILLYSKTDKYYLAIPKEKSYNREYKPYHFKGVEEFKDELGWYTLVNMKDVWSIDMVGRTSKERNGYATQKPEALLARIIEAGSSEGDITADFFAGSSTLAAAADKLSRNWICCDESDAAFECSVLRLSKCKYLVTE